MQFRTPSMWDPSPFFREGSTSQLANSNERLPSGLRIQRPSDDAAGLSVSTLLESQSDATLGAALSRLGTATSTLMTAGLNYDDAASRIRNIDVAVEAAEQTDCEFYSGHPLRYLRR
jgi:flagellin-like hook-associated protein FlgL